MSYGEFVKSENRRASVEWFSPRMELRDWGEERLVGQSATYCGKIIFMNAGTRGGLQYHEKEESHYVVSGTLRLRWDRGDGVLAECLVNAGAAWRVPPGAVHQEEAITDVVVFEVSEPLFDDRVRVEAAYGLGAEAGLPSQRPAASATNLRTLAVALRNRAERCDRRADDLLSQERSRSGDR